MFDHKIIITYLFSFSTSYLRYIKQYLLNVNFVQSFFSDQGTHWGYIYGILAFQSDSGGRLTVHKMSPFPVPLVACL